MNAYENLQAALKQFEEIQAADHQISAQWTFIHQQGNDSFSWTPRGCWDRLVTEQVLFGCEKAVLGCSSISTIVEEAKLDQWQADDYFARWCEILKVTVQCVTSGPCRGYTIFNDYIEQ